MITQKEDDIIQNLASRPLGNTGVQLSVLGFGCASIFGKDMITDEQAQALFERAYELGIRYFDTGHSYGIAEERIGKILKASRIVKREDIVISSKFGTRIQNGKLVHDVSTEWIEESVMTSLQRMNTNYLDCLLCHGTQISDLTDNFFQKISELKQRGIIRAIGANTFDTEVIKYIRDTKCMDFVMLDYHILRQDREPLIRSLYDNGIGVIAGSALGESLWSNRVFRIRGKKDLWYLARAIVRFRELLVKGYRYRFINHVDNISGAQIALRYVLDNPYISSAVFGTTTMSHLEENARAVSLQIPEAIYEKIKKR